MKAVAWRVWARRTVGIASSHATCPGPAGHPGARGCLLGRTRRPHPRWSGERRARRTAQARRTPHSPRSPPATAAAGSTTPYKKKIAMEIVSSNENSTLDWKAQYAYIQDIHDGRGYTAGIIGFCSGTGDMLELVEAYTRHRAGQPTRHVPPRAAQGQRHAVAQGTRQAVRAGVEGRRHGPRLPGTRRTTSATRSTSTPRSARAKADGLGTLGQFIYYDAIVMHGPGNGDQQLRRDPASGDGAGARPRPRAATRRRTSTPSWTPAAQVMLGQRGHHDTSRIDTEQRVFLDDGNLGLDPPLVWHVYGDRYEIDPRSPPAERVTYGNVGYATEREASRWPARDEPDRPAAGAGAGGRGGAEPALRASRRSGSRTTTSRGATAATSTA